MSRSLLLICVLGCLGATYAQFAGVSVKADSLIKLADNLKEFGTVLDKYSATLNGACKSLMDEVNDLLGHINITYTKLNEKYGASQSYLEYLMTNMQYFNQTVSYAESSLGMEISWESIETADVLKKTVDSVLEKYDNVLRSGYYAGDKGDACIKLNANKISAVPNALKELTQCLQTKTNTVQFAAPSAVAMVKNVKEDFTALTNLLEICDPSSTSCVNDYFSSIIEGPTRTQMELYMVFNVLGWAFDNARVNNYYCGILVDASIQDTMTDLSNSLNTCMAY
ncbi:uncharacterized protein LOC129770664 [Toxorhynchites rutilus septentrionalis]|uniref:uncharacterized protein LOC129770664 n=1 Tax=Toxorhynchites rutilus septentrionalis TaxID=329112 RepID=UPI00247B0BE7|nr:uncharacterized protein LOC129770664 [Toxorhynchites rutilus septentrionalis]